MIAIVDTEKTKSGEIYRVMIVKEDGSFIPGYMDGKFLEDSSIDKTLVTRDVLDECRVVGAKKGLWLRNNTTIDRNDEDSELIPGGTFIACANEDIASKDNPFMWDEVIGVKDNELQHGYVVNKYLINSNFNLINGKRFKVSLHTSSVLRLRSNASTSSDIIEELKDGQEVVLIPNVASISDDKYDWFYVAVQTENGIKTGYVAATMYGDTKVINYLVEIDKKEKRESVEPFKMTPVIVDTSRDGFINLKLRENPGLRGKVISEIESGVTIYIIDDNVVKKDRHSWIRVQLYNGKTGFVSSKYLKKYEEIDNEVEIKEETSIDLGPEGIIKGYLGIDVRNDIPSEMFDSLISTEQNYDIKYATSKKGLSIMQKPKFVMFKLGATAFGIKSKEAQIIDAKFKKLPNLLQMTKSCIKNEIPYGFYYFSQAITEDDVKKEVAYITAALEKIRNSDYDKLPIAIDIEDDPQNIGTRILNSASINGKSYQTKIVNLLMNQVREQTGREVILYSDRRTLSRTINFDELDEINQRDVWIVDPNNSHSEDWANNHKSVLENASIRQIALDGVVEGIPLDVDLIDSEYYQEIIKKGITRKLVQ